jgi:cytochrome c oxidase subunit 2
MNDMLQEGFRLFPVPASTFAFKVDQLYWFLIGVTAFFSGLIATLVIFFAIRYRRRPGRVAEQPGHGVGQNLLEMVWTGIPLVLVTIMFVWASKLFLDQAIPPIGAEEVYVVGKQWMWKVQHPNGRREINELHVPVGRPVKLTLSAQDVIHSFFIPSFRVKQDAVPGRYTTMWFQPSKAGEYLLFCAEYCGTDHSRMIGRVVVMEDMDYQNWLGGTTAENPVDAGRKLFVQYDCSSCHESGQRQRCPTLGGLYGTEILLDNGQKVLFDEAYIRESVLFPNAKIAAGFPAVMPTFRGQLSEEQILALIAYIKSLSPNQKIAERKQP